MEKTTEHKIKLPEKIIMRLISSFLFIYPWFLSFSKVGYDVLDYVNHINVMMFIIDFAIIFIILSLIPLVIKSISTDSYALLISSLIYCLIIIYRKNDFYFSVGVIACMILCWCYLLKNDKLSLSKISLTDRSCKIIIAVSAVLFTLFVGILNAMRYWAYLTPGYDFGIFSQMFYYMKETFLPMVTCERDGLLSHFAVHISPIFYLFLPGYFIFPSPAYLEIAQAAMLASGVIPLYMLCRKFDLTNKASLLISVIYLAFPALMNGCFYDLHENKFLTPLILWLFYFLEKDKFLGVYIFSLLTLLVKEDSAIYVFCAALFMIICKKKYKHGIIIATISVLYFLSMLFILNVYGDGAMTGRFDNFISDEALGIFSAVKTIVLNPAYLISQVFTLEKIKFILLMLIPLAFMPVISGKFSRLILLIPMLVINLMSNYTYQHSIDFQYTYGVTAILFYLAVLNVSDFKPDKRRTVIGIMTISSIMLCMTYFQPKIEIAKRFFTTETERTSISQALEEIPKDASIASTPFFIANLSQRNEIYHIPTSHETEYAIFDLRSYTKRKDTDQHIQEYKNKGYEQVGMVKDTILILKRSQ